jgi:hypothetical protein
MERPSKGEFAYRKRIPAPDKRDMEASKLPYDVLVPYLAYIGRSHGERIGIHENDLDDCAITFVERMVLLHENKLRQNLANGSFYWIHTCAKNHALAFQDTLNAIKWRHIPLRDPRASARMRIRRERLRMAHHPEHCVVRSYLLGEVVSCIECLKPEIQELLIRRYLLGEPIREVAASTGRSIHAANQALTRAKMTIRGHLDRRGLVNSEFSEVFE